MIVLLMITMKLNIYETDILDKAVGQLVESVNVVDYCN